MSDPTREPTIAPLEATQSSRRRRLRTQRLLALALVLALCAAVVAVPLALREDSNGTTHRRITRHLRTKQSDRQAFNAVASAVEATTAAGSFNVAYSLTETPRTPTTDCPQKSVVYVEAGGNGGPPQTRCGQRHNVTTVGIATINVNPFAMVAVSNVSSLGAVTVRVDDTHIWETFGSEYELSPSPYYPTSTLSGFANLVEGTLGPREGASAMMGLSSPTGYLSITRQAISDASEIGTGAVDGVPVTIYRVAVDPARLANVPGLSAEEKTTIDDALRVLDTQGFTGNTTEVSVDGAGFVRHTKSVNHFADGGAVTSENTFSAFGCAGVVELPGYPRTVETAPAECADTTTTTSTTTSTTEATVAPTTAPETTTSAPSSPTTASTSTSSPTSTSTAPEPSTT